MRSYPDDDEWDDSDDSPIEDDDIDSDDGEPTVACPYRRREIHEDSQRCPYCEQFVSAEDHRPLGSRGGSSSAQLFACGWLFAGLSVSGAIPLSRRIELVHVVS
jgi:hypothetical protein